MAARSSALSVRGVAMSPFTTSVAGPVCGGGCDCWAWANTSPNEIAARAENRRNEGRRDVEVFAPDIGESIVRGVIVILTLQCIHICYRPRLCEGEESTAMIHAKGFNHGSFGKESAVRQSEKHQNGCHHGPRYS